MGIPVNASDVLQCVFPNEPMAESAVGSDPWGPWDDAIGSIFTRAEMDSKDPQAEKTETPFLANNPLTPDCNVLASCLDLCTITSKSMPISPGGNLRPKDSMWDADASMDALFSNAFVGIHPQFKHTPPKCFPSISAVFNPN